MTGNRETILFVDDDESILNMILDTLQPLGYNALAASNGNEALQLCRSN